MDFESSQLQFYRPLARLGRLGQHPEGRFFPDTYSYAKGSSDLKLLALAMRTMRRAT